jgi:cobyrinic acid a,c-diamide synthase
VVEGVMGLFDGRDGTSEEGSTAQMAKWLGLPVVLVVDAYAQSRSAGAVVKGFSEFDPKVRIAGVVFNRVGSPTHFRWLTDAVRSATAVDVLGGIPNDPGVSFPERHLGLVMPDEERTTQWIEGMADLIDDHVDVDGLLTVSDVPLPSVETAEAPARPTRARIGVIRDEAFCFYYQDNLDLLRLHGAEVVEETRPMRGPQSRFGNRAGVRGSGGPALNVHHLTGRDRRIGWSAGMKSSVLSVVSIAICRCGSPRIDPPLARWPKHARGR